MKNSNREIKLNLIILGLSIFLSILGIVMMFGTEFYDEDVDVFGLPFGPIEVTFWVLGFLNTTLFGTKALSERFKMKSTNIIFAVAAGYLIIVLLGLWNTYNEIQQMIHSFE